MVRLGSLLMGITLILGGIFFPNFTIMWFASPDIHYAIWRQILVVGLGVHMLMRSYYDNEYLHVVWAVLAFGLLWGGVDLFINRPAYLFDTLLLWGVGISFAIDALQKIPVEIPSDADSNQTLRNQLNMAIQMHRSLYSSPNSRLLYQTTIRDDSHVLRIQ